MVTIKIQSSEDIVSAYLKNLGFDNKTSAANSEKILSLIGENQNSGDDIIMALDKLLLQTARKIWPLNDYSQEQLIALFKLLFLLNNGAERWGIEIFKTANLSESLITLMSEHQFNQAPNYIFAKMEPQNIESLTPLNWLQRLLKPSSKKA